MQYTQDALFSEAEVVGAGEPLTQNRAAQAPTRATEAAQELPSCQSEALFDLETQP